MAGITEAIMLICFGVSWPVSAYKSYKARQTGGKSLLFLILIDLGYVVGLIRNRSIEKREAGEAAAAGTGKRHASNMQEV